MPNTYTEATMTMKTHHHKLKKAWLQRHVWTEDLKEAGVNIDQNASNSLDDTPPVLQCEITNKRKKSNAADNNSRKTFSEITPFGLEVEEQLNGTNKKKRKVANTATTPAKKKATESDKVQIADPPVKVPKKRGRKPKVVAVPAEKPELVQISEADEKKTFLQKSSCLSNVGVNINKCRECRLFEAKKKKFNITTQAELNNIFCRFFTFRRILKKNGVLYNAGFKNPYKNCSPVCVHTHSR